MKRLGDKTRKPLDPDGQRQYQGLENDQAWEAIYTVKMMAQVALEIFMQSEGIKPDPELECECPKPQKA